MREEIMQTDPNCIFCKIVAGQMRCFKLLEDDDTLAFMDIYPANDGHCLVVAKHHYPTLFDINEEALAAVSRSVSRVARAVNRALSPVGLNLVQANGLGAQTLSRQRQQERYDDEIHTRQPDPRDRSGRLHRRHRSRGRSLP